MIGIWLMFAPGAFGLPIKSWPADINHMGGALVIVVAVICMGEVVRKGRYINILIGLAVAILPWFFEESMTLFNVSSAISGLLVAGLSIPRGKITESYGLWNKYIS